MPPNSQMSLKVILLEMTVDGVSRHQKCDTIERGKFACKKKTVFGSIASNMIHVPTESDIDNITLELDNLHVLGKAFFHRMYAYIL